MKLPRYLPRLRKPRLIIRRVVGDSMMPALGAGNLVVGVASTRPKPNDVVIVLHNQLEKVKRVSGMRSNEVFLVGDNESASTDSRQFGWVSSKSVMAKVVWPRV
jgi:nickel-type superoxide dismutase maturation protease